MWRSCCDKVSAAFSAAIQMLKREREPAPMPPEPVVIVTMSQEQQLEMVKRYEGSIDDVDRAFRELRAHALAGAVAVMSEQKRATISPPGSR